MKLSKYGTYSLLCSILFFSLLSSSIIAYGASVTVAQRASVTNPGIKFANKFGYVNATLTETFNSIPIVQTNGTIFFDVSGTTAPLQGTYSFQMFGYGNGTLQLRFFGPKPITVIQNATSSSYSDSSQWQQITYSGLGKEGQLVLIYSGPTVAQNSFTLAGIILFTFLSLFFPVTFLKWLADASRSNVPFTALLEDKKRFVILLIAVSIVGIVGVITILLEPLLG